jgi:hypothetical protein
MRACEGMTFYNKPMVRAIQIFNRQVDYHSQYPDSAYHTQNQNLTRLCAEKTPASSPQALLTRRTLTNSTQNS